MKIGPSATLKPDIESDLTEYELIESVEELTGVLHKLLKESQGITVGFNNYQERIGKLLLLLLKVFQQGVDKSKGEQFQEFLAYIKENFNIGRTSYYNYKK